MSSELIQSYLEGIKGQAILICEKQKADKFWDDSELHTALCSLSKDVSEAIELVSRR